jgi:uncharacterized protein (DUF1015 family)
LGRYRAAARTLREWLSDGVLAPDAAAGLYVYEECADRVPHGLQRGLIGALALRAADTGVVLPHEEVAAALVAERRRLIEATEANLEPIFLIYQGGGRASQIVDEVASCERPAIAAATDDGVMHRLWLVTDPARIAAIAADLAWRHAVIADGHHRYAACLDLQARRHAAGFGPGPWDYGMALLVDSSVYPPRIDPIHRVLPGLPAARAVELAKTAFRVQTLPVGADVATALRALREAGWGGPDRVGAAPASAGHSTARHRGAHHSGANSADQDSADQDSADNSGAHPRGPGRRNIGNAQQAAASSAGFGDRETSGTSNESHISGDSSAVAGPAGIPAGRSAASYAEAGRCGTAFLLVGDGRCHLLTDPDPQQLKAAIPAGRSERWQRLDTSVLHELLIRVIWGVADDENAVRMVHHDPLAAIEAATPGGTAIICNPLPVADMLAVVAGGEHLPPKSTSFAPKPRTGLVIRSFEYG